MRWACTPAGVGRPVGYRLLPEGDVAGQGEFESTQDPAGLVLAADLHSLRAPTGSEQLDQQKARKLDELVTTRDAAIVSPVDWSGAQWSALPDDQANLIQAVALWTAARGLSPAEQATLGAPVPTGIAWKTIDNDLRMLSYLEAVQLATAVSIHKQTQFQTYWQLEQLVGAATSAPELDAIAWPA